MLTGATLVCDDTLVGCYATLPASMVVRHIPERGRATFRVCSGDTTVHVVPGNLSEDDGVVALSTTMFSHFLPHCRVTVTPNEDPIEVTGLTLEPITSPDWLLDTPATVIAECIRKEFPILTVGLTITVCGVLMHVKRGMIGTIDVSAPGSALLLVSESDRTCLLEITGMPKPKTYPVMSGDLTVPFVAQADRPSSYTVPRGTFVYVAHGYVPTAAVFDDMSDGCRNGERIFVPKHAVVVAKPHECGVTPGKFVECTDDESKVGATDDESMTTCGRCGHAVPRNNLVLHQMRCSFTRCAPCGRVVAAACVGCHKALVHTSEKCICGAEVPFLKRFTHWRDAHAPVPCNYCTTFMAPRHEIRKHEETCKNTTARCSTCGEFVLRKKLDVHNITMHNSSTNPCMRK